MEAVAQDGQVETKAGRQGGGTSLGHQMLRCKLPPAPPPPPVFWEASAEELLPELVSERRSGWVSASPGVAEATGTCTPPAPCMGSGAGGEPPRPPVSCAAAMLAARGPALAPICLKASWLPRMSDSCDCRRLRMGSAYVPCEDAPRSRLLPLAYFSRRLRVSPKAVEPSPAVVYWLSTSPARHTTMVRHTS